VRGAHDVLDQVFPFLEEQNIKEDGKDRDQQEGQRF